MVQVAQYISYSAAFTDLQYFPIFGVAKRILSANGEASFETHAHYVIS